jgi:hypothetical protein
LDGAVTVGAVQHVRPGFNLREKLALALRDANTQAPKNVDVESSVNYFPKSIKTECGGC